MRLGANGDFIYRHHDVHRSKLYVPDEATLSNPLKKRCHEANDNKHRQRLGAPVFNDYWKDKREVLLSEEWIGTRSQCLRITQEGYKLVNGLLTKVQNPTRLDAIWPEEWPRLSKKQNNKRRSHCSSKKMNYRRFILRYRIPQRDRLSSRKTRKVRGPFNAVFPQRGMLGKPDAEPIFTCYERQHKPRD